MVADDHAVVRRGLVMVLDTQPDLEVVAEAADGAEALELADARAVDLAVLDVAMPRMTGLQAAAELSRRHPEMRLLMPTMSSTCTRRSRRAPRAMCSSRRPIAISSRPVAPPCVASPFSTRLRSRR